MNLLSHARPNIARVRSLLWLIPLDNAVGGRKHSGPTFWGTGEPREVHRARWFTFAFVLSTPDLRRCSSAIRPTRWIGARPRGRRSFIAGSYRSRREASRGEKSDRSATGDSHSDLVGHRHVHHGVSNPSCLGAGSLRLAGRHRDRPERRRGSRSRCDRDEHVYRLVPPDDDERGRLLFDSQPARGGVRPFDQRRRLQTAPSAKHPRFHQRRDTR